MLDENVPGWWLTNCPVYLDVLSLCANWDFLNPRAVHFSSSVSAKAIIRNINSTGGILLPCLAPTLKLMAVSIMPMMSWNALFLYMRLFAEHSLGGVP